MTWRPPTLTDLRASLSDKEITMYSNAATQDVTLDPIDVILRRVAVFVRGYIQSAPRAVRLPADPAALPEAIIAPAMDYAAVDVLKKLPLTITKERNDARAEAISLFKSIARGDYVIKAEDDAPDSASPVHVAMPVCSRPNINRNTIGRFP